MSGLPNPLAGMTFQSGWDSCMARAYCKWPVIAGIVIGSIIVLSVLWCAIKIICCGAQCCFCCVSISKCLCCGCCRGSDSSSSKPPRDHYVSPLAHGNPYGTQKTGYVNPATYETGFSAPSHAVPNGANSGGVGYAGQGQYRSQPAPKYTTASFEEPSKKSQANEDALPAMPSWGEARSTRVATDDGSPQRPGDVEMGRLNNDGTLPKFESDDYRSEIDSAHGDRPGLGQAAGFGAGAGLAAAGAYGAGRRPSYGSGTGSGYGGQNNSSRPNQQSPYGQADVYGSAQPYGQTKHTGPYGQGSFQGQSPYNQHRPQPQSPAYDQGADPYAYSRDNYANAGGNAYSSGPAARPEPPRSPSQGYTGYNAPQRTQPTGYAAYPGQSTYQSAEALTPQATGPPSYYGTGSDHGATGRKPVQGSWKDL